MGIFKSDATTFEMYDPETGDTVFTVDRSTLTVDVNGGIDFGQTQASGLVIEKVAGDPSSPVVGQIWYDTNAD